MTPNEHLKQILNRVENGQQTDEDITFLHQQLLAGDRQVASQLGKYNVNIGEGKEIHIGDRIYQQWDKEAMEALVKVIQETSGIHQNTQNGDAAARDIDKRNIYENCTFIQLLAKDSSSGSIYQEFLNKSDFSSIPQESIQQAYQDALPPDAGVWDFQGNNIEEILKEIQEFRRMLQFCELLSQDERIPFAIRHKLKNLTENLADKKHPEDYKNKPSTDFYSLSESENSLNSAQLFPETQPDPSIGLTDSQRQRLEQQQHRLQEEWDIRSNKLKLLRKDYAIEVNTAVEFQLQQQIQSEQAQLSQLETDLDKIEQDLICSVPCPPIKIPSGKKVRLESYLIATLERWNDDNEKFLLNAWLIIDDSVPGNDLSKFTSLLDQDEQQQGTLCKFNDIPKQLNKFLKTGLRHLRGKEYQLIIEVFLPSDLIGTEIDRWKIYDPIVEEITFGIKYPIRLRSLERLNLEYLDSYLSEWYKYWDKVKSVLDEKPIQELFAHLEEMETFNWKSLKSNLKEKIGLKVTCALPKAKTKELFKAILTATTPIAIWTRCDIPNLDQVTAINEILTLNPLYHLYESVKQTREKADAQTEEHLGFHLALLWEDPYRLTPNIMLELKTPGQ
ncbi:MAG: hypothetical protein V7K48_32285 [Nostoc sp.]|uniref:VMAP-C domain-containing protein n=1 Tax=Nostoc sp. TaxID=1180 RepID=UPI002FF49386